MKNYRWHNKFITRIMRVFFFLLYQPMAWSYDLVAAVVSGGRWKQWAFSVLPYLEGPRVLEIGHGPGHLQVAILSKGLYALGLDSSRQMGRQAKTRIRKQGFTPRLITGYAQNLPLPNESFDHVVATFPTEYIYTDEALAEVFRTLKSGGSLVVLPVAWITGKSFSDRSAATLFRITGQAPEWNEYWLEPFTEAGFDPKADMIRHHSWSLVIILAQKPFSEGS